MICAYYTGQELETAKHVSDPELNKLLQEVRAIDKRYYVLESFYTAKKWIGKSVTSTYYTVLFDRDYGECQIINFDHDIDSSGSIRTEVPKSYVMTLFLGFLNGFNTKTIK